MVIIGNRKFSKIRNQFVITCETMHGDADFRITNQVELEQDETKHVQLIYECLQHCRNNHRGSYYDVLKQEDYAEDEDFFYQVEDLLSSLVPRDRKYEGTDTQSAVQSFDICFYDEFGDTYTVVVTT